MALLWLADALREAGLTVVEHPDWKTHARPGDWSPRFGVVHATAAPRTQADETQVRIVRDGRADLLGPIANATVDRAGRWHVLSAGRCNSTLPGTAGPYVGLGNTYALSTEACNDNVSEPWPTVQYKSYVRGWAAWARRLGWSPAHLVGHKEHTPGHKTDPTFSMSQFRRDVAAALTGESEDIMAALTDAEQKTLAKQVNDINYLLWHGARKADGTRTDIRQLEYDQRLLLETILQAVTSDADQAAILAGVDEHAAALAAQVGQVDEQVVAALGGGDLDEAVRVIRAAIGDERAAELGARLAAPAPAS